MCVSPEIDEALRGANRYRVRPSAHRRAWCVWRFYSWEAERPGWRVVAADLPSSADGYLWVLKRLGLTDETPAEPLPALPPPDIIETGWI